MSDGERQINLRFYPTDISLYDFVEQQANKNSIGVSTYIKRLIQADMARCGILFEKQARRKSTGKPHRHMTIQFNDSDMDVYDYLKSQDSASNYVCGLIREEKNGEA